jgi:hypothetical protein
VPGEYMFRITAWDCTGQYTITDWIHFIILPPCDVDIIELVEPDPTMWHPFAPVEVEAIIKNNGLCDAEGPINVHLQIYEEQPFDLYPYFCTDLEYCHLNTFEVISYDGDPVTWTYTEKRSNSPTHSYHSQPDYLDTYEAYSEDGLILTNGSACGIYIPEFSTDGDPTYYAYLNFSQWVEGEEFYDYGEIQVHYSDDCVVWNTDIIDSGIYDTEGEWEWAGDTTLDINDDDEIGAEEFIGYDLSAYIGQYIMVEWIWYSDAYINREGWYIDDICILLQFTAMQPLVDQQYKYVDTLVQGEERLIKFPLDFEPKEDTWYFFEVYSDLQCCICEDECYGDYDGPKDNEGSFEIDPRTSYPYWLPDNGVNESLYFGDVCDAAVIAISAPAETEMPDHDLARIPIDVTIQNTGTITKDVPVEVRVQESVTEIFYTDDAEAGAAELYTIGSFGADDTVLWDINDFDFYSPYNSWAFMDGTNHYGADLNNYWVIENEDIDWLTYENDHNFDITAQMKWNLNDVAIDQVYIAVAAGNYIISLSGTGCQDIGYAASEPWTERSWITWMDDAGYTNAYPGDQETLGQYARYICDAFGFTFPDQFRGYGLIVFGSAYGVDTAGLETGPWAGVLVDDIAIGTTYAGDTIYSETVIVEDLEQLETEDFTVWWNTTRYCDYIATAEIMLDCDVEEDNNEMSTNFRIYEQIYEDDYEEAEHEDLTVGQEDDWHIVEECSACPDNSFWWNGIVDDDGLAAYQSNADDILRMLPYEGADADEDDEPDNAAFIDVENETFDFTTDATYTLTFDTIADIEMGINAVPWDYGVVEVSNDAGHNWYPIETVYDIYSWQTISWELYNPGGTGMLDNAHYYEISGALAWGYMPFECPAVPRTDEMMFRFHMISDSGTEWKGWYVDNVLLDADGEEIFFDDAEDGEGKFVHMKEPTGDLWREDGDIWKNSDAYYSWYDGHLEDCVWGAYWMDLVYEETDVGLYRNMMDNPLTISFNLTNAYKATLTYEQMYAFTGGYPEDYGLVEIWTDGAWKTLFIVQGDSGGAWATQTLDLTDYVGIDDWNLIRFRMVTNDTTVGEGWQIRNFNIEGKIDNQAPTSYATLDPASPQCNGWYNTGVQVKLTAMDNIAVDYIKYRIDGGSWLTYTAPFTLNLDGEHTVDFYAVDTVGNVGATGSTTFKIDTTNPTGSITMPQAGYIYFMGRELMPRILRDPALIIGGLDAAASASDATSGVDYVTFTTGAGSVEDAVAPYGYPLPFYLFGSDTLTVSVTDEACNTANIGSVDFFKIF